MSGSVQSEAAAGSAMTRRNSTARTLRLVGRIALYVVMIALAVMFLVPLAWVASTSLKTSAEVFVQPVQWVPKIPRWDNYIEVFRRLPFHRFVINSLFVTTMGTIGSVLSSLLVAFGLAKIRWPGRDVLFAMLVATMMLPGVVTMIPVFIIFKYLKLVGTFYPLWAPSWFGGAFYIFLMRQYMLTLPNELNEAAKIDGANNFIILWRVVAPLCGPAIASVAIFSFLGHYNDFMGPLIYISDNMMYTLPMGLLWFQGRFGQFWHLVMAASMISVAPVIVLFFAAQRYFIEGVQFSGLAGR